MAEVAYQNSTDKLLQEVLMYELNKEKARHILINELAYPAAKVNLLLQDYPLIHEQLASAIEQWLDNREIADVEIEGLSIKEVMNKQGVVFLVAIKKLNELLDQNIPLDKRKRMRDWLSRPVYFE